MKILFRSVDMGFAPRSLNRPENIPFAQKILTKVHRVTQREVYLIRNGVSMRIERDLDLMEGMKIFGEI